MIIPEYLKFQVSGYYRLILITFSQDYHKPTKTARESSFRTKEHDFLNVQL